MATILIVDDLSTNRDFLVTLLRHHGHRMLEAADGKEGLAAARAEHPALVITDVLMPVMDGYELAKQLRLDPTTSRIPVVFYTAHYGEREAKALALSIGVSDVMSKPVESAEVLKIVQRILAGESLNGTAEPATAIEPEFDREHLRLLTDQLSVKAKDLRTTNSRLRALVNIGLELASQRDSGRLLQSVCATASDLFGATYVTLGLVDRNDRTVQHIAASTPEAPAWFKVGAPAPGILGTVVAERRTLRGTNRGGDTAALQLPPRHLPALEYLVAPLASPAHVYGWFCLVRNEGGPFTEDDEQLVRALSGQVGRVHENGYFYSVAQKRAQDLEREILERQQVESALRHERDRGQRFLDTADVILLALDLSGRITLINRKGRDLLGCTESELLGRDWVTTCVPERLRQESATHLRNLLGGDLTIVENRILAKSGDEPLIEWRNTLLRDDAGTIVGTLSSGADISDRNEAIEALRAAEARTRFALVGANVGIWDHDYATGIVRWSEISEAHHGLEPGTFAGTFEGFIEHVHPEDREYVIETLAKATRSGTDSSIEYRTLRPDGSVRWLNGTGRTYIGAQGEPVRALGISLDVTDRRLLEDQYHQAQKMDAIGRLAGGVAHDFNNLLTAILGYCELLLDGLEANDVSRTDIAEIQKAGVSAAGLTRQLLAFSRKEIIAPTRISLNMIVTDMSAMLGRLIREDVKVVLGLHSDLALVKADRGQLEQIVLNLAVNARDAMPTGGILRIETANVELDEDYAKAHFGAKPGFYVALTVTDTGIGMTQEVKTRLFEPFFTTKELGRGTGLGLATVHGIVARGGGSVNVYSELGRGTSFKVYFPRADGAELEVVAPIPIAHSGTKAHTVLVVEDAEGLRDLIRRLLERQGYTVLVAKNATEAIGLFEGGASIDVLLTDVVMPGASGPELTKQLVEIQPALRVIYMSGYTEESIVQHGVIKPGIDFLHKPFTSDTLGRKLREVLDRHVGVS